MRILTGSYEKIKEFYLSGIGKIPGGKVLDIGCGLRGNFTGVMPFLYEGIDNDKRIVKRLSSRKDGNYSIMNAHELNFPDRSFDFVISTSLIHHLSEVDARAVSREVFRVLKDNGRAMIVDGVFPESKANIAGWLLRFMDRGRHVRTRADFKKMFDKEFKLESERYFTDIIFSYSMLMLSKRI